MSFATDFSAEGQPGSITPRGVFVPPWYKPHTDLTIQVKSADGSRELGFTIGDVAVERRWAIDPEGCVMEKYPFRERLTEWYIGQWKWQSPPKPALPVDTSAYPSPEAYVAKGPDPSNPRRLIGLTKPNNRHALVTERPVDSAALSRAGWMPAPKKD